MGKSRSPVSEESGSGLEEWQAKMSSLFYSYKMSATTRNNFSGRIRSRRMGSVTFALIEAEPHQAYRTPERATGPLSAARFGLSLQLEGRSTVSQQGRTHELNPGDFCTYDTTLPYARTFEEPTQSLVVAFPRAMLMLPDHILQEVSALVMRPDGAVHSLYSDLLVGLSQRFDSLDDLGAYRLGRAVIDLLSTSLLSGLHADALVRDRASEQLKVEILGYISDNIGDPELSAAKISAHFYISTRYLFQLFSGDGIAQLIRERRLTLAESRLSDPSMQWATIAQISEMCGFINANYFSRVFKEHYGETPSQHRSRVLG